MSSTPFVAKNGLVAVNTSVLQVTSTNLSFNGSVFANSTNLTVNGSFAAAGNMVANTVGFFGPNFTANTTGIFGPNFVANTVSVVAGGLFVNNTNLSLGSVVGNTTAIGVGSTYVSSAGIFFSGGVSANSTLYTGTSYNSLNLGGVAAASFATAATIAATYAAINSPAFHGDVTIFSGAPIIDNGRGLYIKSNSATPYPALIVDNSNHVHVGTASYGGNLYLHASGSTTTIDGNGNLFVGVGGGGDYSGSGSIGTIGYITKFGVSGGFGGNRFNILWSGSDSHLFIDDTDLGIIQCVSDPRIKKNISSITSNATAKVLAMRPVHYEIADVGIFKADGVVREGFLSTELMSIIPSSVMGEAGAVDDNGIVKPQSINPIPIIAVLTKALQEALTRISILEGH
jgi:hypothetical protein